MERRDYPRIDTHLRCELQCGQRVFEGVTLNLSRTGALVRLPAIAWTLSAGQPVVLRVAMPQRPLFEPKCMECTGVICRTKEATTGCEVGLQIESVRFQSAEKMAVRAPHAVTSARTSHVH